MILLPLLASAALGQAGAPERSGVRAEAVARATIISPARLVIATDTRSAQIVSGDAQRAKPRRTSRPCDATATSQSCPAIVFDLP